MGDDPILSAQEWAAVVSTLIAEATRQQDACEELVRQLDLAVKAMQRGTTELARDMPNKIARQAAQEVVQGVADSVTRSAADVFRPAEAKTQTLLSAMERAAAQYQRAARDAIWTCVAFACLSAALTAAVVIVVMKVLG